MCYTYNTRGQGKRHVSTAQTSGKKKSRQREDETKGQQCMAVPGLTDHRLYSAGLCSRADSQRSHVILHERQAFYSAFFWISTQVVYLQCWHGWCPMKLLPSRRKFCVHHTTWHFMQSHIGKVYACLAVTCHLHFWQNDRDPLRATAVTRGWNGCWNKSWHRKLTLEKTILLPLLQGFKPVTFQSRVRRSDHWAIPAPRKAECNCLAGAGYPPAARLSLLQ